MIDSVKRGSQHYTLKTGIRYESNLTLAAARSPSVNHSAICLAGIKPPVAEPIAELGLWGVNNTGVTISTLFMEAA